MRIVSDRHQERTYDSALVLAAYSRLGEMAQRIIDEQPSPRENRERSVSSETAAWRAAVRVGHGRASISSPFSEETAGGWMSVKAVRPTVHMRANTALPE
jgi:hypothetical protein